MLKQMVSFFFLLESFFLYGNQLPHFIDFGTSEFQTHFYDQPFLPELVLTCPLNCAVEMSTFFLYVKKTYQIKTVVETGTYTGLTTAFFGAVFDRVHTIEIVPEHYEESKQCLSDYLNVHCHLGSSPEIMQTLLPTISQEPVLFYLDAHGYN